MAARTSPTMKRLQALAKSDPLRLLDRTASLPAFQEAPEGRLFAQQRRVDRERHLYAARDALIGWTSDVDQELRAQGYDEEAVEFGVAGSEFSPHAPEWPEQLAEAHRARLELLRSWLAPGGRVHAAERAAMAQG